MPLINVYVARDAAEAHLLCDLLHKQDIAAVVMGESLEGLAGAIPMHSARPTVCVNKEDVDKAAETVSSFTTPSPQQADGDDPPWRCPNCGEVHGAQFSECWNCQSPRSDSEFDAPPTPVLSLSEISLDLHLPCKQCEYDLSGLPASHYCPECGYLVVGTLLNAMMSSDIAHHIADDPESLHRLIRRPFEAAAKTIGYPADALMLVCSALVSALPAAGVPEAKVDPREFCLALSDQAIRYLGGTSEARQTFRRWGIRGSEQITQIIATLISAELLPPIPSYDPADLPKISLNDLFPL